ncbi:O-succinylhomoserine sulfhydrylase [Chitinophaga sedimenti]|uniref:O-succinylhomoserine sulfhydrylase n=1 Tax=Chitinophaga sedimenti TaxID=2033606 RepID=UPI00200654CD|nr:O-succinylhomoserine sulfhydrylase [Chitinophaga sedimenti]MCK7555248.1 O-succinylhomoserine sulfhydrylase [Chitinophaga sedimenti]
MNIEKQQYHPETNAIRTRAAQTQHMEHSTPMFLTSSFTFESAEDMRAAFADETDANIYSRFSNPTVDEFAARLASLEGAEAGFGTASGMSAVFASFMAFLKAGDHIVSSSSIFGSTHTVITKFLPKWGIQHTYFDINQPDTLEAAIQPNTKMVFLETPSNPGLDIIDLAYVAEICKSKNVILNVDNCFATPALQKPILHGADIVTHSATKWIDGQGRVLGGAVVGRRELVKEVHTFCRSTGPAMSPFNAWVLSKSLETLHVRMARHSQTALDLATTLQGNPHLEWVKYPMLESHAQQAIANKQMSAGGGLLCFEIKGGLQKGRNFPDAIQMCSLTANLGDSRTIVSHPSSTTHAKLSEEERLKVGITPGMIRISCGLEHVEDIKNDIQQALEKA